MKAVKLGLLSVGLAVGLAGCDLLGGGGPSISSFTANPSTIAPGSSSTLSWSVDSSATRITISGIGDVTSDADDQVTVTPTVTTEYTLTATDADNNSSTRKTTVTVSDPGSGGGPTDPPGGTVGGPEANFGVSTSATGEFLNDADSAIQSDDDDRIISVAPGGTFYAQVTATDPDGIASIAINLVNRSPEDLRGTLGDEPVGGFTLGEPTGDCTLGAGVTSVTCVYPITVGADVVDIEDLPGSGSEFAYVFRTAVQDTLGNVSANDDRGYVNID